MPVKVAAAAPEKRQTAVWAVSDPVLIYAIPPRMQTAPAAVLDPQDGFDRGDRDVRHK